MGGEGVWAYGEPDTLFLIRLSSRTSAVFTTFSHSQQYSTFGGASMDSITDSFKGFTSPLAIIIIAVIVIGYFVIQAMGKKSRRR